MDQNETLSLSIYSGLLAIWNAEFPKTCPTCGAKYENFAVFREQTTGIDGASGLVDYETAGGEARAVGLQRNCTCGSTLSVTCHSRRDDSAEGHKRRALFGDLLEKLVATGIPRKDARSRLRTVLRTGQFVDIAIRHGSADKS